MDVVMVEAVPEEVKVAEVKPKKRKRDKEGLEAADDSQKPEIKKKTKKEDLSKEKQELGGDVDKVSVPPVEKKAKTSKKSIATA